MWGCLLVGCMFGSPGIWLSFLLPFSPGITYWCFSLFSTMEIAWSATFLSKVCAIVVAYEGIVLP